MSPRWDLKAKKFLEPMEPFAMFPRAARRPSTQYTLSGPDSRVVPSSQVDNNHNNSINPQDHQLAIQRANLHTAPTDNTMPPPKATANSQKDFLAATTAYLDDKRFADFTIVCAGKEYKVHRCFISAHSKYFSKCCSSAFREAAACKVDLQDDEPAAVECMIRFFYCHDYDEAMCEKPTSWRAVNRVELNALVYAVAEKYEVLHLKTLAWEKSLKLSFTKEIYENAEIMVASIKTIYNEVPLPPPDRRFRDMILGMWVLGGRGLKEDLKSKHVSLTTLATAAPDFMAELAEQTLDQGDEGGLSMDCYFCRSKAPINKPRLESTWCGRCGTNVGSGTILQFERQLKNWWTAPAG